MSPTNGSPLTSLSLRLLMQGKEVGSIIGKGGEVVRKFREDSRARINISAGTTPDRVVTVQGTTDATAAAFRLVADKLSETQAAGGASGLTLRLIVPASQCGSIIGKGGGKIKELRDETGASIQVAKEMLPSSTDRTVTLAGSVDEVCHCVQLIGYIMLESPPKGANIPYEPNNTGSPFGAGNFGGPNNGNFGGNFNNTPNFGGPRGNFGGAQGMQGLLGAPGRGGPGGFGTGANNMPLGNSGLSGLLRGLGNLTGGSGGGAEALAALAGRLNNSGDLQAREGTTTHEMKVPNEQVGAVIGKGGAKIAEIRAATGAMVTISKFVEGSEDAAKQERTITIKGSADQVALAIYLINNR